MYPDDQKPPGGQQPYSPTPTTTITGAKSKKNPIKLIFIVLGGLFVAAIVLAIVLSAGNSDQKTQQPAQNSATNTAQTPGKASAIDVENVNNSISQSLGGLSDEQDFPAQQLEDKPLGL